MHTKEAMLSRFRIVAACTEALCSDYWNTYRKGIEERPSHLGFLREYLPLFGVDAVYLSQAFSQLECARKYFPHEPETRQFIYKTLEQDLKSRLDLTTSWHSPIGLELVPTDDTLSFKFMQAGETGLPLAPHPGAFGAVRKNHVHEGIDFYCDENTPVYAVEAGTIVNILDFTGTKAGSPWWHDTQAVMVEGKTGVVLYGEIKAAANLSIGDTVEAGQEIGVVTQVLTKDKGRPMTMLHFELYAHGARDAAEWQPDTPRPAKLKDPTPFLMHLAKNA